MLRLLAFTAIVALPAAGWGEGAARAPAGAALSEDLDGDGRPERLVLDADGTLRILDAAGREWGAVRAPAGAGRLGAGAVEVVRSEGRAFVHGRIPVAGGRRGRVVEEVGLVEGQGLREVASFVAGPDGPDAERTLALRADGEGILRYQSAEGIARCDGNGLLFPELYDPAAGRFRPVSIAPPSGDTVAAIATLPPVARKRPLGLFRFTAASTQRGDERRADRLMPPRELDDDRLGTAWYEGAAGPGRGAFVTARSIAGEQVLSGIALAPAAGNRLQSVALLAGGRTLHVVFPEAVAPGRWLWIPLAGVRSDCVTLALDGIVHAGAGDDTGIAEVRIVTEADGEGGVSRLVEQVERGGRGADALLTVLAAHPEAVARELPPATGPARRLLLRALAASSRPEAAAALVAALPTASADDRALVVSALREGGPLAAAAREPLWRLLGDRTVPLPARSAAVGLLGHAPGGPARLWRELHGGSLEDATLRGEVVAALSRAPIEEAVAALPAPPGAPETAALLAARLQVLGAIAGRAHAASAAPSLARAVDELVRLAPEGGDFELRFRWLRAARLAASARLLGPIEREAGSDDEVVRWAAIEAAAAVPAEASAGAVLQRGLLDQDPRVRSAALEGLARVPAAVTPAAERALKDDRWPMVRRTAVERLAASCPGTAALALEHAALADADDQVAGAALASLARCDRPAAGRLALRIAGDMKARLAVRERACALVPQLRPEGGAAALSGALLDLLDYPGSDERHAALMATMALALGKLRDRAGEPALLRAVAEPLLPGLRVAALHALALLCTEGARKALAAARADQDPGVRAAASSTSCR